MHLAGQSRVDAVFEAWETATARGEPVDPITLCAGDPALLRALRSRIAVFEAIGVALGEDGLPRLEPVVEARSPGPKSGDMIDKFRLLRQIGKGGFGVVFEAERTSGYAERVAIKVLNRGLDSASARARFAAEASTLKRVRHTNVASVLDSGVSDDGVPFLVMDLIDGVPLGEFCSSRRMPLRERLELFISLCDAVVHAHANSVIHRDLKPGNVLVAEVNGGAVPKVIDFGLARILDPFDADAGRITEEHELIGTAAYMSPEQLRVREGDPDVRSDVYSLGVMIYEVLSDWLPYEKVRGERLPAHELQRRMRDSEPVPLVTRLRGRKADPGIGNEAREIGWIVMKCLEIERERRYWTCKELRDDIDRYLKGQALLAGPPSAVYRARKFAERNRGWVGAAAVFVVMLVMATVVLAASLARETSARRRAERAEADTQLVAEFQAEQIESIDPDQMGLDIRGTLLDEIRSSLGSAGWDVAVIDDRVKEVDISLAAVNFTNVATAVLEDAIFAPSIAAIDDRFADRVEVGAGLLLTVATAQEHVGLIAAAEVTHQAALDATVQAHGADSSQALVARRELGNVLRSLGQNDEAESLVREALRRQVELLGEKHIDTLTSLNDLGATLSAQGRSVDAEAMFRQALAGCRGALGADHELTLTATANLAGELDARGEFAAAEPYYRVAVEGFCRTLGADHEYAIVSSNNLAANLFRQDRVEEAAEMFTESLVLSRRRLGDNHPSTLLAMANTAVVFERLGRLDDALVLSREAYERRVGACGAAHPGTLAAGHNLADLLRRLGVLPEALEIGGRTVDLARVTLGSSHWRVGTFQSNYARSVAASGDPLKARALMLEAHDILVAALGADHQRVRDNAGQLAIILRSLAEREGGDGYADEAARWQAIADAK